MGQRLVVFDDLSGDEGEDIETVEVGYRGAWYEVELNGKHREELIGLILRFVQAGRRREKSCGKCGLKPKVMMDAELRDALGEDLPPGLSTVDRGGPPPRTARKNSPQDLESVRAMCVKFGIEVGRGRVPEDVWAAWEDDENLSLLNKGRLPSASGNGDL